MAGDRKGAIMAYSTHPTVVTGQVWSASNQNQYVKSNFDAIWPIVKNRQGISTSSWLSTSSSTLTNYTIATMPLMQCGSIYNATTVTFPVAYATTPQVQLIAVANGNYAYLATISTTGFTFTLSGGAPLTVNWLAIGEA